LDKHEILTLYTLDEDMHLVYLLDGDKHLNDVCNLLLVMAEHGNILGV